jgi:translation initiation factor 2B subunit (eIF-2B alpha/beta/delta family)
VLLCLQPGLLSQAFRGGSSRGSFGRAISLSNLLDAPAEHTNLFGSISSSLGSASLQRRPTGSGDSTPTAAAGSAAGPFDEGEGKKWRKKLPPQWNSKNNVIELLNELIDELEGIEQQIAQQAVEHIHANEVRLTAATGV